MVTQLSLPLASRDHASQRLSPENSEAQMMTAGSGQNLLGLWERFARNGQSLKMLLACLLSRPAWFSSHVWLTWKCKVTEHKRLLFQLVPKMRSTEEIGSGLLPTPNTADSAPRKGMRPSRAATGRKTGYLSEMVPGLLPTPAVVDSTSRQYQRDKAGNKILCLPGIVGGRLNPNFVEALMLYPDNWTHPTEPSGERLAVADVAPTTTERGVASRIKMLGNAIVPEVVAEIGRAILEVENDTTTTEK